MIRTKLNEGVKVRVVTRDPANQGNISPELSHEALTVLSSLGVNLDLRRTIHEKLVIVDNETLWIGSLNPLSHTGKTDEIMLRVRSPEACLAIADNSRYRRTAQGGVAGGAREEEDLASFWARENPGCPN